MKSLQTIAQRFQSGNGVPIENAVVPADEWNALVARVNAMADALEPLAALAQHYPLIKTYGNRPYKGPIHSVCSHGLPDAEITVEQLHAAVSALEKE